MLPTIPVDLLLPLVLATLGLCAFFVGMIVCRRLWLMWRGRVEDVLTDRLEEILLGWIAGDTDAAPIDHWLTRPSRPKIQAVMNGVRRVEAEGYEDLLARLDETALRPSIENALGTASDQAIGMLLDILDELGDDATVGRIRACMHRIPGELKPRADALATALRGR